MTRRLARLLLRLYPARIRRRYGAEILELQDEMRRAGDLSVARLTRDVLTGAFLARAAPRRAWSASAAALLLVTAVAGGVVLSHGAHRVGVRRNHLVAPLVAQAQTLSPSDGTACFIDSGGSCSGRFCTEPITGSTQVGGIGVAQPPTARRATPVCVTARGIPEPRVVLIGAGRSRSAARPGLAARTRSHLTTGDG